VAMKKTKTKNVNNERLRPRKQMEHSLLLHVTLIQKSPFAFAWTETWPSKALFGGADRHGLLVLVGESVSSFGPRDLLRPTSSTSRLALSLAVHPYATTLP